MPLYLDTTGRSSLAIGICARCSRKFPLDELSPDPNFPGLRVCAEDRDVLDPYRKPPRAADRITVDHPRPDVALSLNYSGSVAEALPAIALFGIDRIGPARAWRPNTLYRLGDSVTPLSIDLDTTPLPQNQFLCIVNGTSGATAPSWPTEPGVILGDYLVLTDDNSPSLQLLTDAGLTLLADSNGDGTVCWLNLGPYVL